MFVELDQFHDEGKNQLECYKNLKSISENGEKNKIEILWRLARACNNLASTLDSKDAKKKELLFEGRGYALDAYNINDNDFNSVKWAAVMTGQVIDYLGMKEKIEQGKNFKGYLDKAISLNPQDYSIMHMRGRYSFGVASLSWIERKVASTLFATPPTATYEEAISDFLEVEKFKKWIENRLFLARSYHAINDKQKMVDYLRSAKELEPADESEKALLVEVDMLLKKS